MGKTKYWPIIIILYFSIFGFAVYGLKKNDLIAFIIAIALIPGHYLGAFIIFNQHLKANKIYLNNITLNNQWR